MSGFIGIREVDGKPEIVGYTGVGEGVVVLRSRAATDAYVDAHGGASCSSSVDFPTDYGVSRARVRRVLGA